MKEGQPLKYIHLIVEGEVKLTSTKNPYTQKYYQSKNLDTNSDATLRNNANGTGTLSRTLINNSLGS